MQLIAIKLNCPLSFHIQTPYLSDRDADALLRQMCILRVSLQLQAPLGAQGRPIGPEMAKEPLMFLGKTLKKHSKLMDMKQPSVDFMSEKNRDDARRRYEQTIRGRFRPRYARLDLARVQDRPDKTHPAS